MDAETLYFCYYGCRIAGTLERVAKHHDDYHDVGTLALPPINPQPTVFPTVARRTEPQVDTELHTAHTLPNARLLPATSGPSTATPPNQAPQPSASQSSHDQPNASAGQHASHGSRYCSEFTIASKGVKNTASHPNALVVGGNFYKMANHNVGMLFCTGEVKIFPKGEKLVVEEESK